MCLENGDPWWPHRLTPQDHRFTPQSPRDGVLALVSMSWLTLVCWCIYIYMHIFQMRERETSYDTIIIIDFSFSEMTYYTFILLCFN